MLLGAGLDGAGDEDKHAALGPRGLAVDGGDVVIALRKGEGAELAGDGGGAQEFLALEGEHGAFLVQPHQRGAVGVERPVVVPHERLRYRVRVHGLAAPGALTSSPRVWRFGVRLAGRFGRSEREETGLKGIKTVGDSAGLGVGWRGMDATLGPSTGEVQVWAQVYDAYGLGSFQWPARTTPSIEETSKKNYVTPKLHPYVS